MGMIEAGALDLAVIVAPEEEKSKIVMDEFFDEVPTLIQKDKEKWADSRFDFKVEIKGEWFLGSFYSENGENENETSLVFSKFVKPNEGEENNGR